MLALWLLHKTALALFGEKVALWALGLATVYPPFLFYAAQPMRETAMLAVSALLLWLITRTRTVGDFALLGAAAALAGWTNTTFLPFALLLPGLYILTARRKEEGGRGKGAAVPSSIPHPPSPLLARPLVYSIVLVALYSLWPVRNYLWSGKFIAGSTAGAGSTFYIYLQIPEEVGGTPKQQELMDADPVHREGAAIVDRLEQERYFWKAGTQWVKAHPFGYLKRVAERFAGMWRPAPRARAYAHDLGLLRLVSWLTDGWIIPLGFLGLILTLRRCETWPVAAFVLSVNFTYALVFSMIRYRLSLMPWMILYAVAALDWAWAKRKARA